MDKENYTDIFRKKPLTKKEKYILDKKRVEEYREFLMSNQDWDYVHIIDLLRFKIQRVKNQIKNDNIIEAKTLNRIISKMQDVEILLEKVISRSL